jgi:hypothetical protein
MPLRLSNAYLERVSDQEFQRAGLGHLVVDEWVKRVYPRKKKGKRQFTYAHDSGRTFTSLKHIERGFHVEGGHRRIRAPKRDVRRKRRATPSPPPIDRHHRLRVGDRIFFPVMGGSWSASTVTELLRCEWSALPKVVLLPERRGDDDEEEQQQEQHGRGAGRREVFEAVCHRSHHPIPKRICAAGSSYDDDYKLSCTDKIECNAKFATACHAACHESYATRSSEHSWRALVLDGRYMYSSRVLAHVLGRGIRIVIDLPNPEARNPEFAAPIPFMPPPPGAVRLHPLKLHAYLEEMLVTDTDRHYDFAFADFCTTIFSGGEDDIYGARLLLRAMRPGGVFAITVSGRAGHRVTVDRTKRRLLDLVLGERPGSTISFSYSYGVGSGMVFAIFRIHDAKGRV